jgi:hypothetical protein
VDEVFAIVGEDLQDGLWLVAVGPDIDCPAFGPANRVAPFHDRDFVELEGWSLSPDVIVCCAVERWTFLACSCRLASSSPSVFLGSSAAVSNPQKVVISTTAANANE